MQKISVIIPIFGVEKYIAEFSRSLFSQTYENLEVIFINDCTQDRSMELMNDVLKEFPDRQLQVIIINHSKNLGLHATRRSGIDVASGDYIIQCDSDDWIEPDMIEKMYLTAKKYNADAVICDYFNNTTPVSSHISDETEVNCREHFLSSAIACKGMQSVWRFMVKREICQNIEYWPAQSQGEDLTMVIQMAYECRDIRYLHIPLYHWRTVEESLTHSPSESAIIKRHQGFSENIKTIEEFLVSKKETERFSNHLVALKLEARSYLRPLLRKGEKIEMWRGAFPEINGKVLFNTYVSLRHKIEYLTVKYLPAKAISFVYRIV